MMNLTSSCAKDVPENSYLVQYRNAIKNGEIIAGQELIQQLENLIEDLDNPAFVYDTTDANDRIEFIEQFCKHTKSPFYGQPFILELWEKAFIEAFYSFKWSDEGYEAYYGEKPPKELLRRFKKAILLIARKNGKSTLCAALGLTEMMCGTGGNDIVCSSNDDAQANIIFEEINNMREQFDPKDRRTHKNMKGIFNLKNKSKIFKISDRTRNKEGRNIDGAILDESNEMTDNVIAKSIDQSQSTKDEPWFINITTEGFVNDGYLDKELKYGRAVLAKEIEDHTLLVWLYTQDSEAEVWQNPRSHQKSNPSLGTIKKVKYIKDQIRKAQHDKAERIFMLAKDFNIKQNNAAAWLLAEEIVNEAKFDIADFRGSFAIGGVDLSKSGDLACARLLFIRSGKKYTLSQYFIPESKLAMLSKEDLPKFKEWIRLDRITVCDGNENDFSKVTAWFVKMVKEFGIKIYKVGYDKWSAVYWVKEMEDLGFDMQRVVQDWAPISEPMKLVEADLRGKLINYNDDSLDRWCLENTALAINNKMEIMPVKVQGKEDKKIDGAVTLIICTRVYIDSRTEYLELTQRAG
ncbi:terminase large subunit [Paenibacillus radicis (ex Xue et al. 2023)]|uniref:Terminase large subunit n=1 Tax=Paenibacillus radicis (ex Xue et al. 2023) TaxID=2972489 RepID=A0ABT1YRF3_9BACL|nr:terminase TerL endonuclease subunit [Paenibacillus radicis (ex Xue et al. 2023)]MCR8635756.1 terminase large subunit [Paenibacillus radicis (ex Xue et al. 2023)]